jgi:hypothetical protein
MFAISFFMVGCALGFAAGYAVRDVISQRRRAFEQQKYGRPSSAMDLPLKLKVRDPDM